MATDQSIGEASGFVQRLLDATNSHRVDEVVACFAADYVNETPAHPARGFRGSAQVRRNWEQIFGGVPDLRARVVRSICSADTAWVEWDMRGTRRDGAPHVMAGVTLFGVQDGLATWARFYLEPVDGVDDDADRAVRRAVGAQ